MHCAHDLSGDARNERDLGKAAQPRVMLTRLRLRGFGAVFGHVLSGKIGLRFQNRRLNALSVCFLAKVIPRTRPARDAPPLGGSRKKKGDNNMQSKDIFQLEITLPSISLIIAAYNEQAWLEVTLSSILSSGFPCEIIVVDDGSTDNTPQILKKFSDKVKVYTHTVNKGKGAAIATGLREASGEIVIFCDAHLLGLGKQHLLGLVMPLVYGNAQVVLGVDVPEKFSISLVRTVVPSPILTGQRAYFKKDLLPFIDEFETLGYGIESFLFTKFPREKTAVVLLPGLVHLHKQDTSTILSMAIGYLREAIEILDTIIRIKGVMPKEIIQLRMKISAILAKYSGTKNENSS